MSSLTRREFLGNGVGTVSVLGFSLFKFPGVELLACATEGIPVAEVPVIWIATGSCTGCSVSLLNTASPNIQETLLGEVLPGKHLSLGFHATVMAASGRQAIDTMEKVAKESKGQYVLVLDGATAAKDKGLYCQVGEHGHTPITGYDHVRDLGTHAAVVLAMGTCAAFGGIPAASPNPTGAIGVSELFRRERITTPLVNIPGCPPHPDWIVSAIAAYLIGGVGALKLDEHRRPSAFFGTYIHDNCQFRGHYDRGQFAEYFGDPGCLFKLGCKGPITLADCPARKFNNGTSWCCEAGHPCIGCCNPAFPFEGSLFAFDHAMTGQALDENHTDTSCQECHTAGRYDRTPSCMECHDPEDNISFPAKRPGPVVSAGSER